MRILVAGLPGSGKTTQARILASELGVHLIEMGATLRTLAIENSDIGEKLRQALENGDFVEDNLVSDIIKRRVLSIENKKGFVMDGYPRALSQLKLYDPQFDKVFYLEIPDEMARDRLLKREREDDLPHIIDNRLKIQKQALEELLAYFREEGVLTVINGDQPIEKVHIDIRENLL